MKKVISTLLVILLLFTIMPFTEIDSFAATSGDFEYYLDYNEENACVIAGYNGSESKVMIPSQIDGYTVIGINGNAFDGCTSLTSITIPNSVTEIGFCAFRGCTSLTDIIIPDSIIDIGDSAFVNTAYYNTESNWENGVLYIGNHLIEAKKSLTGAYDVRQGTKTIADYAFYGVFSSSGALITSVTIPDSVIKIGFCAFSCCTSLTSVTISNSVTEIEDLVFKGCTSLTSVTIGNSVEQIGEDAFANCKSLASITIPDSVTYIWNHAFEGCTSLANIAIPDSVTHILNHAFSSCPSLTSVIIPKSVKYIAPYAFGYNYNVETHEYEKVDGFTIYGKKGSVAETYAVDNAFIFIPFAEIKDNKTDISVIETEPGVIPKNTELKVENIENTATRTTYNISLVKNGTTIQPTAPVMVRIPVPDTMDGASCKVYRQEADGTYTDMNAIYQDGYMVFTTDHFSEYILTTGDPNVLVGDTDGNGVIDDWDSVLLDRYLAGWDVEINTSAADMDKNGIVDDWDGVLLARKLAGWN